MKWYKQPYSAFRFSFRRNKLQGGTLIIVKQRDRKSSSRGLKKKVIISFGLPKEKKLLKEWRTGAKFLNFFGNFFNM